MGTQTGRSQAGLNDIELHDIDAWHRHGYPWEGWARLRREAPVYWYERPGIDPAWMVTRYADVRAVSADPSTFINGGPQLRYAGQDYNVRARSAKLRKADLHGWDPDVVDDMIYLDAAEHGRLRSLMARSFTPARCRRMAAELDATAADIVAGFDAKLADGGEVCLVNDLAVKLPLATICSMLGLPASDWADIHRWTDAMFDVDTMRWAQPGEDRRALRKRLHGEFHAYIDEVIAHKRAHPGDDLATQLVQSRPAGDPLLHQELHGYLKLLISGGNGAKALCTSSPVGPRSRSWPSISRHRGGRASGSSASSSDHPPRHRGHHHPHRPNGYAAQWRYRASRRADGEPCSSPNASGQERPGRG